MEKVFSDLRWHQLSCQLIYARVTSHKSLPIVSIQSAIKSVSASASQNAQDQEEWMIVFHIPHQKYSSAVPKNGIFPLVVSFFKTNLDRVQYWKEAFVQHMKEENNFLIAEGPQISERTYEQVAAELGVTKTDGELCLEFLTPFPFKRARGRERTFISKEDFLSSMEQRISRLFGREIKYRPGDDQFTLLPYYWQYVEVHHPSTSQPGSTQYINGCVGPLYLKGSFRNLLPFLVLGAELHAGAKLSNTQGYYLLHKESLPHFGKFFPNKKSLLTVIKDVKERYDRVLQSSEEAEKLIVNEEQYAESLVQELTEDRYTPSPATAFIIKKKDGSERFLEHLPVKDLIVHEYALKTISEPFDRFFEEGSIGFRKGFSREKAIEMVQTAIAEGFQYVVESDVADFFPSIEFDVLLRLLNEYIPDHDMLLKDLLVKCVRHEYILNGEYHERAKGLAQGSPLSPILANLYLDSFDEHLAQLNVKMIRYADDFIILTRSKEEAEKVFSEAETFLSTLGLGIKREKTAIKPITAGFQFLGITFNRSEVIVKPEEELKRLKKPLYVTEPHLFLSLNGEALDIMRNKTPIETIPLRRLSEIIVMEKVAFSTALLRKCTEENIPLTITLGSGYYITTVKPDSKRYYNISYEHGRKHASLSDTEVLSIAKEFAACKIRNYSSLFRQKYVQGQNVFLKELQQTVERIYQAADIHVVRGLEGAIARKVYQHLNTFIDHEAFHIRKRERKNPDHINSLLNFGYYLLYSRINATVRSVGLNPYLGFLHEPEDTYESLVADMQELFRARIDRFLIRLTNLKVITPEDFSQTDHGAYLTHEAIKKFLNQFELEMEKPSGKAGLSLKDFIYVQVIMFKKWVLDNGSLTFYLWDV